MIFDPSSFLNSGQDFSLTSEEKKEVWTTIRHSMHRQETDLETDIAAFFVPLTATCLSKTEKKEGWLELASMRIAGAVEEQDIIAMLAPLQEMRLEVSEKEILYAALKHSLRPSFFSFSRYRLSWAVPVLALLLVISASAGISYAAESSLPGDFLYPFKQVEEQIQTRFNLSEKSRAQASAQHLGTRVQEVQELEKRQRLNDNISVAVDQEFRLERRMALSSIQQLDQDGEKETASSLRARLNAYQDAYERLQKGHHRIDLLETTEQAALQAGLGSSASSSSSATQMSSSWSSSMQPGIQTHLGTTAVIHVDVLSSAKSASSGTQGSSSSQANASSPAGILPSISVPF
jgi:hypothetical protein